MLSALALRRALLAMALLSAPGASAAAQDPAIQPAVIEVGANVSRVWLGLGGAELNWLRSARLVYRPAFRDRRGAIEVAYGGAPQNRDPYHRSPGFRFASAQVRHSFMARPQRSGADPFFTLGIASVRVDAEEIACIAPCLDEGPNYQDETMVVPVIGLGMLHSVTSRYAARGDFRFHKPMRSRDDGSDNGDAFFEFAFGVFARF